MQRTTYILKKHMNLTQKNLVSVLYLIISHNSFGWPLEMMFSGCSLPAAKWTEEMKNHLLGIKKKNPTSKLNSSGLCSAPESCQQAEDMTLGFFPFQCLHTEVARALWWPGKGRICVCAVMFPGTPLCWDRRCGLMFTSQSKNWVGLSCWVHFSSFCQFLRRN